MQTGAGDDAAEALDQLGRCVARVYDTSLGQVDDLISEGAVGALARMTPDQLRLVRAAAPEIVATVLFEWLAEVQLRDITDDPVQLLVRGADGVPRPVSEHSAMLGAELFFEDGWLARFAMSRLPACASAEWRTDGGAGPR